MAARSQEVAAVFAMTVLQDPQASSDWKEWNSTRSSYPHQMLSEFAWLALHR
jgi:hypothetical protein